MSTYKAHAYMSTGLQALPGTDNIILVFQDMPSKLQTLRTCANSAVVSVLLTVVADTNLLRLTDTFE